MEDVVQNYFGTQFQQNFRMSRPTFNKLYALIAQQLLNPGNKPFKSLEKDLLATIWLLATPDSFRYYFNV